MTKKQRGRLKLKSYPVEYPNGTTWFPLRQVSAIFFNADVLTVEDALTAIENK